jgi:8-oxo-dGTP pyrophosphatase MutT (NUDIX family)
VAPDLGEFLARHTPVGEASAVWGGGTLPLRVAGYVGDEVPPLAYITSVRGLVFRADSVLVLRNADGIFHLLPGGRREAGESLPETLRREVLEETGWLVDIGPMVGFIHFHHLSPKQPGYGFPHPDFISVIHGSEAVAYRPEAMLSDDYELEAAFRTIDEARALPLEVESRLYLEAALRARGR